MRPIRLAIPADDVTIPVPLDIYQKGPVTVGVDSVDGVVDIDIQYTTDDIFAAGYDPSMGNWVNSAAPLDNITAALSAALVDSQGNAIVPTAIRALNNVDTGTARLVVLQAGVMG